MGTVKGLKAKIHVDPKATPLYHKARSVPLVLREKIETELDRLQAQGIIEPVQFSEWAAPTVPVIKSDGSVRICGDYKVTVNRVAKLDKYPLPLIDDLFASLAGGKRFTTLDLSHAYQQIELDDESRHGTSQSAPIKDYSVTTGYRSEWRQPPQFSRGRWKTCSKASKVSASI